MKDPTEIDFVLLNGGANDVVLSRVISKAATPDWIAEEMRIKCGERMRAMLCYLVGLFPNARFAVTGYYPLVSAQSFATTDAIARIFQRLYGFDWTEAINYAKGRDALLQKSYAFANESTKWLQWATNETNTLFPNRVVFAKPVIDGDRCLAATDTHIWGLEADPVRALRITQCQAAGRLTLVDFDAMVEGRTSGEIFDITCAMASVMHPNAKGAQRYFEALASALPAFFPYWEV